MDTTEHAPTRTALITPEDAATLRQAREILGRLNNDATDAGLTALRDGWPASEVNAMDYGRMSDAAEVAQDAIFHFLNISSCHCDETNVDFGRKTA